MTELIELDLTEQEQELYIRRYITNTMSSESLEQYIEILNMTDSVAEASKAAILNQYITNAIIDQIK